MRQLQPLEVLPGPYFLAVTGAKIRVAELARAGAMTMPAGKLARRYLFTIHKAGKSDD